MRIFQSCSNQNTIMPCLAVNAIKKHPYISPYTPEQIKKAYFFPDAPILNQNISIVVAYGYSACLCDLDAFSRYFQLPPPNVSVFYPQGTPELTDPFWALETALDLQWTHALAPESSINLVVAKSASDSDLIDAVDYAVGLDAPLIAMCWGTKEFTDEIILDYHFRLTEVTFIAASGNSGVPSWPSVSPSVISAGGTSLQIDSNGRVKSSELAWYFSGGGISEFETRPRWQYNGLLEGCKTNFRITPDISFFSDPCPGVPVYISIPVSISKNVELEGWTQVGGTSLSCIGITSILSYVGYFSKEHPLFLPALYHLSGQKEYKNPYHVFHDIKNGNSLNYPASCGYDLATGLGTLHVSKFLRAINELDLKC
ncbi:MAG: hypothetical protein E7256_02275 [Lachnospiraceae bacterium]|nr:hypothetical protein [Lachnospiraceae bacterium]